LCCEMFDLSKRELAAIIGTLIIVVAVTAWATVCVIDKYVLGDRDDPLVRAGGLKPEQSIKVK
jgi:hypothetical protein